MSLDKVKAALEKGRDATQQPEDRIVFTLALAELAAHEKEDEEREQRWVERFTRMEFERDGAVGKLTALRSELETERGVSRLHGNRVEQLQEMRLSEQAEYEGLKSRYNALVEAAAALLEGRKPAESDVRWLRLRNLIPPDPTTERNRWLDESLPDQG